MRAGSDIVGEELVYVCRASDVRDDVPAKARIGAEDVAVFKLGDRYFITQNICSHGPGELSDGYVEGDEIECPFHQGRFKIATGQPSAPPCTVPLKTWAAEQRDGNIYASPSARA